MARKILYSGLGAAALIAAPWLGLGASDHDDGENELKGRNLNLTDLYVFREQDQDSSASPGNLVLIMNTNPRSIPRQQYYFSTFAHYEIHVTRRSGPDEPVTGADDVVLRFEFGPPDEQGRQAITMTPVVDGRERPVSDAQARGRGDEDALYTTPLDAEPVVHDVTVDGAPVSFFAGLREDPFFFDVQQFFRVRAGALGLGPPAAFRPPSEAVDFADGYNVNAVAVRVPIAFLGGADGATTFDVWTTICVPRNLRAKDVASGEASAEPGPCLQLERLARPAINEGLVVTNAFLNAFNMIPPSADLSDAAAPVRAEAARTIRKVDLLDGVNDADTDDVAAAFLPDVMRIDASQPSGYGAALNAIGSPVRGRLIMDDVIDITLTLLVGSPVGDNVFYEGVAGNPAQTGHKPLLPSFPYLAAPE